MATVRSAGHRHTATRNGAYSCKQTETVLCFELLLCRQNMYDIRYWLLPSTSSVGLCRAATNMLQNNLENTASQEELLQRTDHRSPIAHRRESMPQAEAHPEAQGEFM